MSDSKHLVFTYGTLKRIEPNYEQMTMEGTGTAVFMGVAETVEKYPLVVASKIGIPFMIKYEGHGDKIQGEVFEVDDTKLAHLDRFEGHPNLYLRQEVDVVIKSGPDDVVYPTPIRKIAQAYFVSKNDKLLSLPWTNEFLTTKYNYDKSENIDNIYQTIQDLVTP